MERSIGPLSSSGKLWYNLRKTTKKKRVNRDHTLIREWVNLWVANGYARFYGSTFYKNHKFPYLIKTKNLFAY